MATLEAFLAGGRADRPLPPVVVEVCDTRRPTGPICGFRLPALRSGRVSLEAAGTSFANLTFRHGAFGIQLARRLTDTTVERIAPLTTTWGRSASFTLKTIQP